MELSLEDVVGLISKQPAEFIATLKSEDGEWKAKDEILSALRKADKDRLDNIAKGESGKAVRLRMKQAQNYIKENFGVESDANEIEDHLKALVENLQSKAGKEKIVEKVVDLTEETALQNPIVKNLLKSEVARTTAEMARQLEEEKKKHQSYIEEDTKKKLDSSLYEEAARVLSMQKAALDKDEAQKQKQIRRFVQGLKSDFKFKLDGNGKPYPVDQDGEPLQEGYVEVSFADLIKKENIFGVHNFDPDKDSASATSKNTSQAARLAGVTVPKTMEELTKVMYAETDPDKKEAILQAFQAQQAAK